MPARTRQRKRRDAGEVLIEFALTLPIFLMTLLGTAEFGLIVFQYNMVSNLAQEGARRAVVCGRGRSIALNCNIQSFVQSRSLGLSPTVTVTSVTSQVCTSNVVDVTTLSAGTAVCVTVQKPFTRMNTIVPLVPSISLQSTAQMIISR